MVKIVLFIIFCLKRIKKVKYNSYITKKMGKFIQTLFFGILILILALFIISSPPKDVIREPAVAGLFYPSSQAELAQDIASLLDNSDQTDPPSQVRALIVPHAGYRYSGQIAAQGFSLIDQKIGTVIILAASHNEHYKGASIAGVDQYKTPLGQIKVSSKAEQIRKHESIISHPSAHIKEHSIEVELPFLQHQLGEFEIIPILISEMGYEELAQILLPYVDEDTLIVASSDLSHYYSDNKAQQMDQICINAIQEQSLDNLAYCEACGIVPIATILKIAQEKQWKSKLLDSGNSGDVTNDKSNVVGYASFAFVENYVQEDQQEMLLTLARNTVEEYIKTGLVSSLNPEDFKDLSENQGCYVTLTKEKEQQPLRGCIGDSIPLRPLYECVQTNAINAAVDDDRFQPVREPELDDITIEVSVLTVPKDFEFDSPEELLEKLRPNIDGVFMQYRGRSSLFLPSVWEQLPDKERFLENLCEKQDSPPNCWQREDVKIQTFQAQIFEEE